MVSLNYIQPFDAQSLGRYPRVKARYRGANRRKTPYIVVSDGIPVVGILDVISGGHDAGFGGGGGGATAGGCRGGQRGIRRIGAVGARCNHRGRDCGSGDLLLAVPGRRIGSVPDSGIGVLPDLARHPVWLPAKRKVGNRGAARWQDSLAGTGQPGGGGGVCPVVGGDSQQSGVSSGSFSGAVGGGCGYGFKRSGPGAKSGCQTDQ